MATPSLFWIEKVVWNVPNILNDSSKFIKIPTDQDNIKNYLVDIEYLMSCYSKPLETT